MSKDVVLILVLSVADVSDLLAGHGLLSSAMSESLDNLVGDAMRMLDGTDVVSADDGRGLDKGIGVLPGHQVDALIARGGMGVVYRARHTALEREVAVKVMVSHADSPEMAARFRREALVLGKLAHPNIVPIHEIGTDDDGQLFYTMKLVKGRTLQAIINGLRDGDAETLRQHSLASLLTVFRKVCDAMAFAHSQGVLHRDLKPENVMVGEFGEVLVMDWGLAKELDGEKRRRGDWETACPSLSSSPPLQVSSSFTMQGSVMGTPQYMSPEQARGEINALDERSDIFSLGGILYTILTLRPPVEGTTLAEVLEKVRTGSITPPTAAGSTASMAAKTKVKGDVPDAGLIKPLPHVQDGRVPAALSAVVMKALRREKAERYQDVAALSADIEKFQGGFATQAEQAGAWTQLKLLMLRHKAVTASLAALLIISALFVVKVMASERKATANAAIAAANERRANEQTEQTRCALKTSQLAVAEASWRAADLLSLKRALESVPEDLRDPQWAYLAAKQDASSGEFHPPGFATLKAVKAVPGKVEHFAIADEEGRLGVVNADTSAVLWSIKTGLSGAVVLAVSDDGRLVAATDATVQPVHLFSLADGSHQRDLPGSAKGVTEMVFSPDGTSLAVLYGAHPEDPDGGMTMLDVTTGSVVWRGGSTREQAVFSTDGRWVFVSSRRTEKFTVFSAKQNSVHVQYDARVICLALSGDKQRVALGCADGEVIIFNLGSRQPLSRTRLTNGDITWISWTANDHLMTVSDEHTQDSGARPVMKLWETAGMSCVGTFLGVRNATGFKADFDKRSGCLLALDDTSRLWRIGADLEAARIAVGPRDGQGWASCFTSDSEMLGRGDHSLARFDVNHPRQPQKKRMLPCPPGYLTTAVDARHSLLALASQAEAGPFSIKVLDVSKEHWVEKCDVPVTHRIVEMDFDAEGTRLLALSSEKELRVVDARTGAILKTLPQKIEHAVFAGSADSIVAVVSEQGDEVVAIDASTGQSVKSLRHEVRLNAIAASPDRRLVAIGGKDRVIRVLDAATLETRHTFPAHDETITALAFQPGQAVLASASADESVKLWNYETQALRDTFLGFDGAPDKLAFSPGGHLLSVEGPLRAARLLDLRGPSPASTPVAASAGQDAWEDFMAPLTPASVQEMGDGWRLENGALFSPPRRNAKLLLGGDFSGTNYAVRVRFRMIDARESLHVILPVGNRMTGFDLHGFPKAGYFSGLCLVDGKFSSDVAGAVRGKVIHDAQPHRLEITVRLLGFNSKVTATLDDAPFYEWTGPIESLSQRSYWESPTGTLGIGAYAPNWVVEEVKARRMTNDK